MREGDGLDNDKESLARLKKGDEEELGRIIEKYTPYVSSIISRALGGFSDIRIVEEIASDTFFRLWQSRKSIRSNHLRGYLSVLARNGARDYLRKLHVEEPEEEIFFIEADDSFERASDKERADMLKAALSEMQDDVQEIMIRFYYNDEKIAEIASALGINRESVKSKLRRGREKLKDILIKGGYIS